MSAILFQHLQDQLIEHLRGRVRNGDLTERSLARLTGISQPHVHNVLKRHRVLSPELSDLVMQRLQLSLLDLIDRQQMVAFLNRHSNLEARAVPIPVLQGLLGPGYPLPRQEGELEFHTIPHNQATSVTQPVVARLALDAEMGAVFQENDLVLLDQSETLRSFVQPHGYYVVNSHGGPVVRSLRRDGDTLFLVAERFRDEPAQWPSLSLAARDILDVVLARVVWLNRRRRWDDLPATA